MFELSLGPLAPSHVQAEMPDNNTTTDVKSFIFKLKPGWERFEVIKCLLVCIYFARTSSFNAVSI